MKLLRIIAFVCLVAYGGEAFAQNNGALLPALPQQFLTANGAPAANGRLCTQVSGTNTPLAVYADPALTLPLPNPVKLNAAGIATTSGGTQTAVYTQAVSYRVTLYAAGSAGGNLCNGTVVGALIWQFDGVYDFGQIAPGGGGGGGGSGNNQTCKTGTLMSDKINAAYALVPNTGGIIDCTNLIGAQTLGSDPFTAMTKSVTVIMPVGTATSTVSLNIPSNVTLLFPNGAILSNTNTTTIAGNINAGSTRIFTNPVNINTPLLAVYPQWFGAKGDNSNDDTVPIQEAIDSCRGPFFAGVGYGATCHVIIPVGTYKTTAQLNMYSNVPNGAYLGMSVSGVSAFQTQINYGGPSTSSAFRMIGQQQTLSELHIINNISTGWLDGVQYDGSTGIGISTAGRMDDLIIECVGHPGNGISMGRGAYQADQLLISNYRGIGCSQGYGFVTLDPNALSVTLLKPAISSCWIGIGTTVNSTNITLQGGEIDSNDLNFRILPGTILSVYGVRSENSKTTIVGNVASAAESVTFSSYLLSSTYWSQNTGQPRPATNATNPDSTHITLSVANSVTWGDWITIAGAGSGGTLLHTHIASMTDPTHAVLDTAGIITNVTNAAVNLDTGHEQYNIYLPGGGPYQIIGCAFNTPQKETSFWIPAGSINIATSSFLENFANANPFNINISTTNWSPGISWTGLWYNGSPSTRMVDHSGANTTPTLFFGSNAGFGANNAWVVSGTEPLANGLRLEVVVTTFTLQAGANTLNYNGHGTDPIWKSSAASTNLTTAVNGANQYVELVWDGSGGWRLQGQ